MQALHIHMLQTADQHLMHECRNIMQSSWYYELKHNRRHVRMNIHQSLCRLQTDFSWFQEVFTLTISRIWYCYGYELHCKTANKGFDLDKDSVSVDAVCIVQQQQRWDLDKPSTYFCFCNAIKVFIPFVHNGDHFMVLSIVLTSATGGMHYSTVATGTISVDRPRRLIYSKNTY